MLKKRGIKMDKKKILNDITKKTNIQYGEKAIKKPMKLKPQRISWGKTIIIVQILISVYHI